MQWKHVTDSSSPFNRCSESGKKGTQVEEVKPRVFSQKTTQFVEPLCFELVTKYYPCDGGNDAHYHSFHHGFFLPVEVAAPSAPM